MKYLEKYAMYISCTFYMIDTQLLYMHIYIEIGVNNSHFSKYYVTQISTFIVYVMYFIM